MFTIDIPTILQNGWAGKAWCVRGDQKDYASLEWLDESAKPTEQALLDAELAASKASRIAKVKTEAQQRILADYPAWKQDNAALGGYDAPTTDAIKAGISAIRTASNAAEADIAALSDVATVVSFTW